MFSSSNTNHSSKAEEFWQFSCDFYQATGVKECLLSLQDEYQLNVNQILLCIWLAYVERQMLSEAQVAELIKWSQQAKDWVERQRQLRIEITSTLDGLLKKELLELELHLEKLHQLKLVECCAFFDLKPDLTTSATDRFRRNLVLFHRRQKWLNEFDNLLRLVGTYFDSAKHS